jgi:hypothetical protein
MTRALILWIVGCLAISGFMGWLVVKGLRSGETWLPSKQASHRRVILREKEPASFYVSLSLYGGVGLGALGFGVWLARQGRNARPH